MDAHDDLRFTLDGQIATVDDYLELRPDAEPVLRALIAQGRISVGPWSTLPDEFLVSGETLVRNLRTGITRARELGGAMRTGYLPDMFGHIAQMPQILRRAGIDRAVVWRGVPASVTETRFTWSAPDGSGVSAEYMPFGYGNAASLFAGPGDVEDKVETFVEQMRGFANGRTILAMHGTDHTELVPGLVDIVTSFNFSQKRYRLEVTTLDAYMDATAGAAATEEWSGEMRSGARANVLMGVTSARIDAKAACAKAEQMLERYAEPLGALFGPDGASVALDLAWDRMIANSAHDSICGCSVDEVADQVLVRYAEARQIAEELVERAMAGPAAAVPRGRFVVVNPTPWERSDVVELDFPVDPEVQHVGIATPSGVVATQEVARQEPLLFERRTPGDEAAGVLRLLQGRELFGRIFNRYEIAETSEGPILTIEVDAEPDPPSFDVAAARRAIEVALAARPEETWTVRVVSRARRRLLARVQAPALGWAELDVLAGDKALTHPVQFTRRGLSNGLVEVAVGDDGTLDVEARGVRMSDAVRLVEGGDAGDSYNYGPPARDRIVEQPEEVAVRVIEDGPVRARLEVARTYRWPTASNRDGRSAEEHPVEVLTELELHVGEPFLRVGIGFENPCSDHRVRAHVPLPAPVASSHAEGGFAVVERALTREGGHGEVPVPTHPAGSFVSVEGLSLLLPHTMEYEVVDGRELALTVLRSTGLISRNANPFRDEPAGPEIAIPKAQRLGRVAVAFALYPHQGSWEEAGVLAAAECYRHPFVITPGKSDGTPGELRRAEGLRIEGEGVALTCLRRTPVGLEARLVRYGDSPATAVVSGGFSTAAVTNLLGEQQKPLSPLAGRLEIELGPWEIVTLLLIRE